MKQKLTEIEDSFIKFNILLSTIAIVASLFPLLLFIFFYTLAMHGVTPIAGAEVFKLIPVGFYSLWFASIFAGLHSKIKKSIGNFKFTLFVFNLILTIPLLIFYLVIFIRLTFGI